MLNQTDIDKVKEITKEFFDKTTFEVEIEFLPQEESTIPIKITTDTPQILIGERGQTLVEIQHLLKAILRRNITGDFYIDLDVNGYKQKKIEYLKELARNIADEVSLMHKEKSLPSMPAYERRVIHMELAKRSDVVTESVGREPDRRLLVKPA